MHALTYVRACVLCRFVDVKDGPGLAAVMQTILIVVSAAAFFVAVCLCVCMDVYAYMRTRIDTHTHSPSTVLIYTNLYTCI